MPIVINWNPAHDIFILDEAINNILACTSDVLHVKKSEKTSGWTPAADMYETDESIVIHVELTGIDKDSLEIAFHEECLFLQGNRPFHPDIQPSKIHRVERTYGWFSRVFRIPKPVDSQQINASYENGVLTIILTKLTHTVPGNIKIPVTFE